MKQARKKGSLLTVLLAGVILLGGCLWGILLPDQQVSGTERRRLAEAPELSAQSVRSGSFMTGMEQYLQDQFPLRDGFRSMKALVSCGLLGLKDSHGIYLWDGYVSRMDYPLDADSVRHAAERFGALYEQCLKDSGCSVYVSVIPDKNQFMAVEAGVPCLEFRDLTARLTEGMPYASYIEIGDLLELEDYYKTDIHWRQERLADVARRLAEAMGAGISGEYRQKEIPVPFYGVYRGQSALPLPAESLICLEADFMEDCRVYDYETGSDISMYDPDAAEGNDPYSLYLAGSKALLRIENPGAPEEKRLILFRDSFGSSIAPLLAEGFREVILVDLRYISPAALQEFVTFDGQEVLFLYSENVLNNSETLK